MIFFPLVFITLIEHDYRIGRITESKKMGISVSRVDFRVKKSLLWAKYKTINKKNGVAVFGY